MKKIPHEISRRKFIKTGLIWLPTASGLARLASAALVTRFTVLDLTAGSSIKARTISSVVDNRISLSNSRFARLHSVSSAWTKVRIALRAIMTNTGASITGSPDFFVGLSSGTTAIYGDASATHAVGIHTNAATWTYSASNYYSSSGAGVRPRKQVLTTFTNGSALTTGILVLYPDATVAQRWLYFVDITKGSPNYTFDLYSNGGPTSGDISSATFLAAAQSAAPSVAGHTFSGSPQTLAVNEGTDGTLDAVNLAWNVISPTIEICEIAVVRLA